MFVATKTVWDAALVTESWDTGEAAGVAQAIEVVEAMETSWLDWSKEASLICQDLTGGQPM